MENSTCVNFKERLKRLIAYQDVLARNSILAQRTCDQEFGAFLTFHNDLRRKYMDLRAYVDQQDRCLEQYRTECARQDKKIQSQSAQILRLTQHNKRNTERLTELQRCLDQIKGTITGQNTYDQLRDILRDSLISDSETTADLSDKNCTGDELDTENVQMPKVVSQSNGIGTIKRPVTVEDHMNMKYNESSPFVATSMEKKDLNIEADIDQICASPYANITVGRAQTSQIISPTPVSLSRHSLSASKRPKQKIRKPSQEFLNNKSEESELDTDDFFWSKPSEDLPQKHSSPSIYPILTKLTSPTNEQKTLTPSTPTVNMIANTISPSIGTLRAKAHNFVSRNILIPETCCVCLKRINFGKLAYRCQGCSALCHTGCKENCSTLCLPNVKTPTRGVVSKFSPRETNQLQVPALLLHCIKEIEQRGLQEVGLYRLNAVESQVKELKERLLKSRTGLFDLSHYQDIHLICGVVKDFLRSLSESLLTDTLWKTFASLVDDEYDLSKQSKFDSLIQQLPKPNRDTLAFLILHLQRVAASPICRMPITNLSRTMGPAVIGYSSKHLSNVDIVAETYKQTKILECFLKIPSNYWSKFLENNDGNISNTPLTKQQIGTPIYARQYQQQQQQHTPLAPCNAFFSPI